MKLGKDALLRVIEVEEMDNLLCSDVKGLFQVNIFFVFLKNLYVADFILDAAMYLLHV